MIHFDFTVTWTHIILAFTTIFGGSGLFAIGYRIWRAGEILLAEHNVMWKDYAKRHGIKLSPRRLAKIPQFLMVNGGTEHQPTYDGTAYVESGMAESARIR